MNPKSTSENFIEKIAEEKKVSNCEENKAKSEFKDKTLRGYSNIWKWLFAVVKWAWKHKVLLGD